MADFFLLPVSGPPIEDGCGVVDGPRARLQFPEFLLEGDQLGAVVLELCLHVHWSKPDQGRQLAVFHGIKLTDPILRCFDPALNFVNLSDSGSFFELAHF